ncbi:hypothetical protein C7974DRAFT_380262 [Boeremia exigua]|uniref:uncharacterized protein n=1 Tax=Boeremia exigua TaxID=749465 RepID=UPI001E8D2FF9|nr:uncharacterized protein C7974DRAFT_380262 [Boeremia exigua]KAH6613844.1 hypothetical protein C7974DRAFT_380262 [Boeremia exigua]
MATLLQALVAEPHRLDPHAIHASALSTFDWHAGRDDLANASDMALLDQVRDDIKIDMKEIYTARMNTARYLLLTATRSVLWDFHGCAHLAADLETIDEIRVAKTLSHQCAGVRPEECEKQWTADMASLIISLVGANA